MPATRHGRRRTQTISRGHGGGANSFQGAAVCPTQGAVTKQLRSELKFAEDCMWMDAMLHSARHVMAAEKEGRQVGEAEMVQLFLSHSCPFAGASNRIENKSSLGLRPKSWHDDGNAGRLATVHRQLTYRSEASNHGIPMPVSPAKDHMHCSLLEQRSPEWRSGTTTNRHRRPSGGSADGTGGGAVLVRVDPARISGRDQDSHEVQPITRTSRWAGA